MSSQQQSQSYKRRSSGKRTRPSQRSTTTLTTTASDQTAQAVAEADEVEEPRERPAVTRQVRERASAATSRGTAARAPRAETARSRIDSVVNTQRFDGVRKFIREAMAEIQKVIWPDRDTTRNLTLVVLAVSVILGLLLGGIDFVLFKLFEALP